MSSSGDSGMQPDNDDPLDLQLLDNDVPLLAYVGGVGALLLIISVSMCTTVLCVYYRKNRWGNRSQPNTKGKPAALKHPYRLRSQNDLAELVGDNDEEAMTTLDNPITPASLEEELISQPVVYEQIEDSPQLGAPSTEAAVTHVTTQGDSKPPVPKVSLPPAPSMHGEAEEEQPPSPLLPTTRRFTFEDGTFLRNYPAFCDPDVHEDPAPSTSHNIYSSQYLAEGHQQEEAEPVTPTGATLEVNSFLSATSEHRATVNDEAHVSEWIEVDSERGGETVAIQITAEAEQTPTHHQHSEPQEIVLLSVATPSDMPVATPSDTSDEEGHYAVPIFKEPQANGATPKVGTAAIFDDPGYMTGMMVRRQHTAPLLPWYTDNGDEEEVWPPVRAVRRSHSHSSLAVTRATSKTQRLPHLAPRRAVTSSMDALALVRLEGEDLDPDIAAAWFGRPEEEAVV